jgi:hypothetical protein
MFSIEIKHKVKNKNYFDVFSLQYNVIIIILLNTISVLDFEQTPTPIITSTSGNALTIN